MEPRTNTLWVLSLQQNVEPKKIAQNKTGKSQKKFAKLTSGTFLQCIQRLLRLSTFSVKASDGVHQRLGVHWGVPNVRQEGRKLGDDFLRAQGPEVNIVTFS